MASTTSTELSGAASQHRRALVAACVLAISLTGCGVLDRSVMTPAGGIEPSVAAGPVDGSGLGGGSPAGVPVDQPKADHVVHLEGALTRLYDVPSLTAFAGQRQVSNVIVGTVTKLEPLVTQPGNTVETLLLIDVASQREKGGPTQVEVREQGGVVPVEAVRSDFEGKIGRKLTSKELAQTVDYQFDGQPHAKVGDRVLVIVADDGSGEGRYVSLARLAATGSPTSRELGSSSFSWPGERPNAKWQESVRATTLLEPAKR